MAERIIAPLPEKITIVQSNGFKVTLNIEHDTDGNLHGFASQQLFIKDTPVLTDSGTVKGYLSTTYTQIVFQIEWNSGLIGEYTGEHNYTRFVGICFELTRHDLTMWAQEL